MTFDQFVLMYSVFSDRAPREMKIHYAFLIYGKIHTKIRITERNSFYDITYYFISYYNYSLNYQYFDKTLDMDGDGFIGTSDIEHALKLLTQNELNMEEIQSVWEKVNNVNILQIIELFITPFFVLFNYNYNLKQF